MTEQAGFPGAGVRPAGERGKRAWPGALCAGAFQALVVLLVTGQPVAMAQEAEAESSSVTVEEIVVTARKREESIQETPIAVTAFSGEQLRERNLTNLMEIGSFAPNVTMATANGGSGGGNNGQVYIRGIGQIDFLFTTDPGVGIYIDGVYHPRTLGAVMDLLDLERIEILRGPQGTLFGKNTIGGALSLVSVKPTDIVEGFGEVTIGDFDRFDFRGSLNFPVVEERLLARVSVSAKNRDGYGKRLDYDTGEVIDRTGDEDQLAARLALRWLPSEKVTVDFNIDYTREREQSVPTTLIQFDDTGEFGGVPIALWNALIGGPSGMPMSSAFITGDEDTSYGTGPNRNTLDMWGTGLTVEVDLGFATLKSITAYREMEASFGRDGDGSPLPVLHTDQDQDQDQFSQEFQLYGSALDYRLDWLVGAFYFDEFGRDQNDVVLTSGLFGALEALPVQLTGAPCAPPFLAPGCPGNPINPLLDLDFDIFNEIDITSWALFGQLTYDFTDKLSLTAGARYSYEEKEYTLEHRRIASNTFIVPYTVVSDDWGEVTPMASLSYQATDDVMFYGSVSRGFKSGGFNGRPIVSSQVEAYDPEFVWAYELGIKSEWLENRLRVNAALFFSDYQDIQFTAVAADPNTGTLLLTVDNLGDAEIKGVELEVLARPVANLDISLAVGYTDFEITKLLPSVVDLTEDSVPPRTPEWTASGSVQYGWNIMRNGFLAVRGDWIYESESFADTQNTPSIARKAHSIFNARLTYSNVEGDWEIALFGTNLTDERVVVSGLSALTSFGTVEGFYNRPREWGASFRMNF